MRVQPYEIYGEACGLRSGLPKSAQLDEHLEELLSQLEPVGVILAQICAEGARADFFCGLFLRDTNEGVHLSPELVHRIAALGASLDFDIYAPASRGGDALD
ncbi:MAG TPA: DUF4279 domain-containing protein [Candidatus Limnocylindria bacterium]|nr:DUF4279 domain-containing protein [Candidatus Limnocylindria bacterium]